MSAPPYLSSLEEILVDRPMPKALDGALDKAWKLPVKRGHILLNRLSEGDSTGDSAYTGEGILSYLTGLIS